MNFSDIKSWSILDGDVQNVAVNGVVLWERPGNDWRDLYQRVEYIETPGGSAGGWFVTDFVADNTCGMELVASYPASGDVVAMGSRVDTGSNRFYAPWAYNASSFYVGFNSSVSVTASFTAEKVYVGQLNFLNSRYARIYDTDGKRLGYRALSGTLVKQTCPVAIFRYIRTDGTLGSRRAMKFYSARCSRGSVVEREYLPCYRKSDGEIVLIETYSGQILTNSGAAGSTYFTKGPDVDW